MKRLLTGILFIIAASSCHKVSSNNSDDNSSTENFEPTKQYDIKIKADNQKVVVDNFRNQDTVLSMTYYEKIALIVRPTDYNQSWALHFTQAYTGTALDGVLFTTPNKSGSYTYNWIDDNLNNVTLDSKTDTSINGTTYLNLRLSRVITFLQAYPAGKTATDAARTALLQRKSDVVTFSSYYVYNDNSSVPVTTTAALVYTKP